DIADLNLDTGRIADGAKSDFDIQAIITADKPQAKASVRAKSDFQFELEQKHYVLNGLDAEIKGSLGDLRDADIRLKGNADLKPQARRIALEGLSLVAKGKRAAQDFDVKVDIPKLAVTDKDVAGGKVSGNVKLAEGPRTMTADFSVPSFEGSPQAFKIAALNLDAVIKEAQLEAKAKISGAVSGDIDKLLFTSPQLKLALDGKQGDKAISGTLTTPLQADLKAQTIRLPAIAAAFTLPNPGGGTLKLNANGQATTDLNKQTLSSALKGTLDESSFDIKFGLTKFSPAAYTFDAAIDRIDADRYRSKPASADAGKPGKPAADAPESPIDLSALKTLNASGKMRIGALKVANIKASNVRFDLHAAKGRLEINGLSAALYGGKVAGNLSAAATTPPRFTLRQNLSGIAVGNLLKDAMGKDPIDGKGNVQLDVQTQGATASQLKKALDGNARLELRDGSVRGVNIAKSLRDAKARLNALRGNEAPQSGTASTEEKTDFSELSGSFRIANGVAHNEDLSMKSPLLRLGGSGDVNLGQDRLDYLVKATVVQTLQGQGGPELQALKGLTVPVRLSGPFTAIGWKVDFAGLASGIAKQKIDEKKEEVRGKVKEKIQEELGDRLKGLFGTKKPAEPTQP
ncbi:MAG: AsmA family protein, partial [Paucimonas sp.]|nr:AsmA family protein [Paucimonas sp.]